MPSDRNTVRRRSSITKASIMDCKRKTSSIQNRGLYGRLAVTEIGEYRHGNDNQSHINLSIRRIRLVVHKIKVYGHRYDKQKHMTWTVIRRKTIHQNSDTYQTTT